MSRAPGYGAFPTINRVQFGMAPSASSIRPVSMYAFQPVPVYPHTYAMYEAKMQSQPPCEPKGPEDLRESIRAFVDCLEKAPEHTQAITVLSNRFGIKRRRLYDVINVFESVGACRKSGLDAVKWLGLDNMKEALRELRKQRGIDDTSISLEELFPPPCCVGISNLTMSFLLLFSAVKTNRLDLRFVSQFFSHGTTRYKTTLCKLYQICYILGAIGVTKRTAHVCEVILSDEYCDPDALRYGEEQGKDNSVPENAMSIRALLNKAGNKDDSKETSGDWLEARRKALESCYVENVTGMQDIEIKGLQ